VNNQTPPVSSLSLEITGNCVTMVAKLEGGIQVIITDCEGPLSLVERHLGGRAAGFYVGLHPAVPDTEGDVGIPGQLAFA